MCDALMELMKDELEAKKNEGKIEGKIEGAISTLLDLIREGVLTIPDVAVRLQMSEDKVREML